MDDLLVRALAKDLFDTIRVTPTNHLDLRRIVIAQASGDFIATRIQDGNDVPFPKLPRDILNSYGKQAATTLFDRGTCAVVDADAP